MAQRQSQARALVELSLLCDEAAEQPTCWKHPFPVEVSSATPYQHQPALATRAHLQQHDANPGLITHLMTQLLLLPLPETLLNNIHPTSY